VIRIIITTVLFAMFSFASQAEGEPKPPPLPPLPPTCFIATFDYKQPADVTSTASYVIWLERSSPRGGETVLRKGSIPAFTGPKVVTIRHICVRSSSLRRVLSANTQWQNDRECVSCTATVALTRER
jgi:hypothetical protein